MELASVLQSSQQSPSKFKTSVSTIKKYFKPSPAIKGMSLSSSFFLFYMNTLYLIIIISIASSKPSKPSSSSSTPPSSLGSSSVLSLASSSTLSLSILSGILLFYLIIYYKNNISVYICLKLYQ